MTFKKWLITLMVLLLAADIAILLDIPVLRQVLGFLCFTTVPGLLILYTLKLHEISFLKKFLLSVGLSLSFLIFVGLLVNTLLPWLGNPRPLSTPSLVISLSLVIAILCFTAYWRNRTGTQFTFIPKFGENFRNKRFSLLLLPMLFPFLAVIGTQVMDAGGSNVLLIVMYLLIPLYITLVIWQKNNIPKITYPIAIGMITMSMLLPLSLLSNYLRGSGDIYSEYHAFQVVYQNLHWSVAAFPESTTGSLSVSLLPAMFQSILRINPLYIFKVLFIIPISLIPVIGYAIYEKYLGSLYGFLSSVFIIAQPPFTALLIGGMRVGLALISLSLAVMVLFDDHITGLNKRLLFLVLLFTLVVEYYVLPVIFLGLMFVLWLVPKIWKGSFSPQPISSILAILLPSVLIFLWWSQITGAAFVSYVLITKNIFAQLSHMFIAELRGPDVVALFSLTPHPSVLMQVPGLILRISVVSLSIGIVSMVLRKKQRLEFSNYTILVVACFALLVAEIIVPWLSIHYVASRLYFELLVIMAPAFVIGCQEIAKGMTAVWIYSAGLVSSIVRNYRPKYILPKFNLLTIILIGAILVSQLFCCTGLYQLLVGMPGYDIDKKSRGYYVVHDSDVQAAKWLGTNNTENLPVYISSMFHEQTSNVFEYTDYGVDRKFALYGFDRQPTTENSYIFLHYLSVVGGLVSVRTATYQPRPVITEYDHLYADKSKIYANGGAEIYR